MPHQGRRPVLFRFDTIEQWMANKADTIAGACVEFRFEGKYHRQTIGPPRQLANASAPPRPYLWRNVVEHWHSRAMGGAGQNHVELGEVDQDQQVGRIGAEASAQ